MATQSDGSVSGRRAKRPALNKEKDKPSLALDETLTLQACDEELGSDEIDHEPTRYEPPLPGNPNTTGQEIADEIYNQTDQRLSAKETSNFRDYIRGVNPYLYSRREEIISEVNLNDLKEKEGYNNDNGPTTIKTKDIHVPNCADIKLFEDYYILSTDNKLIKKCCRFEKTLDSLKLVGAGRMCKIKRSSRVAVVQTQIGIVCLETSPKISVIYKIGSDFQFGSLCHLDTYVNTTAGLPNPTHFYAATSTTRMRATGFLDEIISIVKPKKNPSIGRNTSVVKTPYISEQKRHSISGLSGICSIASVWKAGIYIIVGGKDCVASFQYREKSGLDLKWKISLHHAATDVVFMDPNILVCVQDEGKIMAVDFQSGSVVSGNILDRKESERLMPCQISVCKDMVLVKSYSNEYWRELKVVEYSKKQDRDFASSRRERTIIES